MIAVAKKDIDISTHCCGDLTGITIQILVTTDQKWKVKSMKSGYYYLYRNGGPTLRLTPAAMSKYFNLLIE